MMTARIPSFAEVVLIEIEDTPAAMRLFRRRWPGQCSVAIDRPAAHAHGPGNMRDIGAGLLQAVNGRVLLDQPGMALLPGFDVFLEPLARAFGHDGAGGDVG